MPALLDQLVSADCIQKILTYLEIGLTTAGNGAPIIRAEREDLDPAIVFHADEVFDVTMQQDIAWNLGISNDEFEKLRRELCDPPDLTLS